MKSPYRLAPTHLMAMVACLAVMALIVALGPYSTPDMFAPDQGRHWYFWKLQQPDFWSRFSAWFLYSLHQAGFWLLIAAARRQRPEYGTRLHRLNWYALLFNLVMVLLHVVQTRLFYDGLAQDTPVVSSQFSVIFMLVFVLLMENRRRGLLFGWRLPFGETSGQFLRRYHGYYFAWAIVYTFWFHPIEDNLGHLLGTFYILLLLVQGSLFFTRFHRNPLWTTLLEVFVAVHGAWVAYMSVDSGSWQMFLYGFLWLFIITQMHGLGLSRLTRWLLLLGFVVVHLVTYWDRPGDAVEVTRIPLAELGLAAGIAGVVAIVARWRRTADA